MSSLIIPKVGELLHSSDEQSGEGEDAHTSQPNNATSKFLLWRTLAISTQEYMCARMIMGDFIKKKIQNLKIHEEEISHGLSKNDCYVAEKQMNTSYISTWIHLTNIILNERRNLKSRQLMISTC